MIKPDFTFVSDDLDTQLQIAQQLGDLLKDLDKALEKLTVCEEKLELVKLRSELKNLTLQLAKNANDTSKRAVRETQIAIAASKQW